MVKRKKNPEKGASSPTLSGREGVSQFSVEDFLIQAPDEVTAAGGLDAIRQIFKLGGPIVRATSNHTESDNTRRPGKYDRHLDESLRLKKIAFFPGLVPALANIADASLDMLEEKLGRQTEYAGIPFLVMKEAFKEIQNVEAEACIVDAYKKFMPEYVLPIVSSLFLQETFWDSRYLSWRKEAKRDVVIPDAALIVDPNNQPSGKVPHICPLQVATGSTNMRNKKSKAKGTKLSSVSHKAVSTNCTICDDPTMIKLNNVARHFQKVTLFEFKSLVAGSYETMLSILKETCADAFSWEGCSSQGCKGTHSLLNVPVTGDRTAYDAKNPLIEVLPVHWKATEADRALLEKTNVSTATFIIQQMWAEMVRYDATFIVLNAGVYELIAYRNRSQRTLYFSDIINTTARSPHASDPGYFQIHVGLFLASIHDAVDRAEQIEVAIKKGSLPHSWTAYGENHRRVDDPSDMVNDEDDIDNILLNCPKISLESAKERAILSYQPRTFYERRPEALHSDAKNQGVPIEIMVKPTNDPNVYTGTVKLSGNVFEDYVIVKTAVGKACDALIIESSNYATLGKACGIPPAYGRFEISAPRSAVLVLRRVGIPVSESSIPLSVDQQSMLIQTLRCIHDMDCVHNRLTSESVVVPESDRGTGEAYLVSLGHIRKGDKDQMEQEMKDLEVLCRKFGRPARRRLKGHTVILGTFKMSPRLPEAKEVFEDITAWMDGSDSALALITGSSHSRWVNDLRHILEVEFLTLTDKETFMQHWENQRPIQWQGIRCL